MAHLQNLTVDQISQAVTGAVDKQTPITVTIRTGKSWNSFYSRFLATDDSHLLILPPTGDQGDVCDLTVADRVGVSFKFGHYKHVFSATVVGRAEHTGDDGQGVEVVQLVGPSRMQRLQRRAFQRVAVPDESLVRAAFWVGGSEVEPTGRQDEASVWTGTVGDISAGGFQMNCHNYTGPSFQVGELVGVRLMFGVGGETCFVDGQFRHAETHGEQTQMGFQFVGLGHSRQGRAALQLISAKVAEFQRASNPRRQAS